MWILKIKKNPSLCLSPIKSKRPLSLALGTFFVAIILFTGMLVAPVLNTVSAVTPDQQPQSQGGQQMGIDKIIDQITTQVIKANPDTNAAKLKQMVSLLTTETTKASGQNKAMADLYQILLQVNTYPHGLVRQALNQIIQQTTITTPAAPTTTTISDSADNLSSIVQLILHEEATGMHVLQSLVNVAVKLSSATSGSTANQIMSDTAEIISNKNGAISVPLVEAVIKQLFLQKAKASGGDSAVKSLQEMASEVKHSPTGPFSQAIIQLSKSFEKDGGKTTAILTTILDAIKGNKETKGGAAGGQGGGNGDNTKKIVIKKEGAAGSQEKQVNSKPSSTPTPTSTSSPSSVGGKSTTPPTNLPPGLALFPEGTKFVGFGRDHSFRFDVPGIGIIEFPANAVVNALPGGRIGVFDPMHAPVPPLPSDIVTPPVVSPLPGLPGSLPGFQFQGSGSDPTVDPTLSPGTSPVPPLAPTSTDSSSNSIQSAAEPLSSSSAIPSEPTMTLDPTQVHPEGEISGQTLSSSVDPAAATTTLDPATLDETNVANTEIEFTEPAEKNEEICDNGEDDDSDGDVDEEDSDCEADLTVEGEGERAEKKEEICDNGEDDDSDGDVDEEDSDCEVEVEPEEEDSSQGNPILQSFTTEEEEEEEEEDIDEWLEEEFPEDEY